MKKQLLLLLVMILLPMVANADASGTCGESLTWKYEEASKTLTISGTGAMTDYDSGQSPWRNYCQDIVNLVLDDGIMSIGNCAFSSCSGLTAIAIPNSVKSIGDYAFQSCTDLTTITIPNSVTAIGTNPFSSCSKLATIVVQEGNPYYDSRDNCNAIIGTTYNNLISGCSNTIIPKSVVTIDERAFGSCENLVSIDIPNGVTTISQQAFINCRNLKNIKIPISLKYIYVNAFKGCFTLESVEIENIEAWYDIYFGNNQSNPLLRGGLLYEKGVVVEDLVIPNNITSIGSSVFYRCGSIKTLTLHSKVESIGANAFACNNITKVYCYAEKIPQTDSYSFDNESIKNATLYVPESSITDYMTKEPWCNFGTILTLSGEDPSADITDVNSNLSCSVDWNGSQASSITPWGSNYARGVNATIYNFSNVNITVTQIDAYINDYPIGSIPDFEQTLIEGGSNKTFSFSVTNNYAMPSTLPWLKIHYTIGKKEFVKDSREAGTSNIKEALEIDNTQDVEVYSLDGRKLDKPQKGLNIIRSKNGKTKKVVIK